MRALVSRSGWPKATLSCFLTLRRLNSRSGGLLEAVSLAHDYSEEAEEPSVVGKTDAEIKSARFNV